MWTEKGVPYFTQLFLQYGLRAILRVDVDIEETVTRSLLLRLH